MNKENKKVYEFVENEIKKQKYIIREVKLEDNFLAYTDIEKKIVYFNTAKKAFDNVNNRLFIYSHELQHINNKNDGMLVSLENSLNNPHKEDVEAFWYILRKIKAGSFTYESVFDNNSENIIEKIMKSKIPEEKREEVLKDLKNN